MDINKGMLVIGRAAVILFVSSSAAMAIIPGQLSMSGELIEAGCEIDPQSRHLSVDFGEIAARDINFKNESRTSRPFSIRLTGCSTLIGGDGVSHYPLASITFLGDIAGSDASVLKVDGAGEGFGIRIRDRHGATLIFGRESPGYELSENDSVLRFTATLVPVHNFIKAGDFFASARFFIDYQ
ncbi:fimbrial protein [Salmonella enterica subsp. enterica serovar Choleraesuis]|nr:fimbrial protein [Salmonella enterica subsp. enterica serovar Choleraesuis]